MKNTFLLKIAKLLMRLNPVKIAIVDDQHSYFNKTMLSIAKDFGYRHIERYYRIDRQLLNKFKTHNYDIFIFDIKGIVDPSLANNGFDVASLLYNKTSAYIVITSAHKFNLNDMNKDYDHVIQNRLLTALDFVNELDVILQNYFALKLKFYNKILFKIGLKLMRMSLTAN